MSVADRAEPPLGETVSRSSTPTRVLVAVSAAFVPVALVLAGRKGFWLDEGFTAAFVRQPWSDFLHELTKRLWVVGYAANIAPGLDMGVVDQAAKARGLRLDREYRFGDTLVRHYS